MPFIHPVIFWTGLGAVSAPIIIHLLNRRRFRLLYWAAMKFLNESLRRNRRRLKIEELILLALRCLAILALALAVARFTGCGAMAILPASPGPQTTIFILDDSYSMGQKRGAGTIFGAAKRDLADRIKELPKSERVAIILASAGKARDAFFDLNFITDAESLIARIEGLAASDKRARLAEALATADQLLGKEQGAKQVFLLSDCRRLDLAPPEQVNLLRKRFTKLRAGGAKLIVMDYGRPAGKNLTIESIELADKFAVAKVPFRVALAVRNNGQTTAENVEILVQVRPAASPADEGYEKPRDLPVQVINSIEPGQSRRIEFQVTCGRAGAAAITTELPGDELPGDNKAYLALDVRQVVKMLVVDGEPDLADREQSESFFFALIVDPTGDAYYRTLPDVVSAEALGGVAFDDYDLVALLNVADFPVHLGEDDNTTVYPQLEALEKYVRGGGGLAIFTGDRVNLDFYNGPLYAGGAGLSPLRIGPSKGDPRGRKDFYRLAPRSLAQHSVLQVFHTYMAQGADITGLVRFFTFTPASELDLPIPAADIKPPRVLARFTDQQKSPAIVSRTYGKGNVLMFYTTADKEWNDWPIDPVGTYGNVINDMVRYLARPQRQGLTALVGEPIAFDLSEDLLDAKASLKTPGYPASDVISLVPAKVGNLRKITYAPTIQAGMYILDLRMPDQTTRPAVFARNVDGAEGDLTWVGKKGLRSAFDSNRFTYVRRAADQPVGQVHRNPEKEYWTYALAAMLILLAAETFLAQRFGHYSGR